VGCGRIIVLATGREDEPSHRLMGCWQQDSSDEQWKTGKMSKTFLAQYEDIE
jgi:hypothetical protein